VRQTHGNHALPRKLERHEDRLFPAEPTVRSGHHRLSFEPRCTASLALRISRRNPT
jgi:hypothetical protein